MKEYIECRNCDSKNCSGCNINTLATMLREGKFDCLLDEHHSINPAADVVERKRGGWIEHKWAEEENGFLVSNFECSACHEWERKTSDFCPNCGADMRSHQNILCDQTEEVEHEAD